MAPERPDPTDLELTGELDFATAPRVRARLEERCRDGGDVVVDMGGVSFADVVGCRALLEAAEELPDDRRLVLIDPPSPLTRVLTLCGWIDDPRLVVEERVA